MTFLSLFSGIGAFDLGLERAGMTCVGQVEIELFPRAVLAKHWPNLFRWCDVCDLPTELVRYVCGRPDCIAGGFACQDVSCAGQGKGIGRSTRSGLTWRNAFRLIRGLRPAWIILENVPALRSRGADRVLRALERIGYACRSIVVGAEHVGAPHKRHRVWIVGQNREAGRDWGYVADAERINIRQQWECAGEERAATAIVGGGGENQLAYATDNRPASGPGMRAHRERPLQAEPALGCGRAGGAGKSIGCGGDGVADTGQVLRGARRDDADRQSAERSEASRLDQRCGHPGVTRWPSHPGQRQHEWERPRLLAHAASGAPERGQPREDGAGGPRPTQLSLGSAADGPSARLVRASNRHALKALGNAVCWPVPYLIGLWVVEQFNAGMERVA